VDNRAPTLTAIGRQILSTENGVFLIPTKVRDNSFTFTHATGYARQYLLDVYPLNAAMDPLQQSVYSGLGPAQNVEATALSAINRFESMLRAQSWPSNVAAQVRTLDTYNVKLANAVRSLPRAPALVTPTQSDAFFRTVDQLHDLGVAVRTRVGLG
jgi:hypothetical protein